MKTKGFTLLIFLIMVAIALVACANTSLTQSDPYVSGVQAYATLAFIHAVQTSTAQAHYAEEWQTTVQAAATQDAQKVAYLAAQTTSESLRASAVATQTQQVWRATTTAASNQATTTAEANATAVSWYGTATQAIWNSQATANASGLQAQQTAQAAQAAMAQLSAERQQEINQVQAAAPWVILVIAVPLVAYLAWIWGKTEVLRRRAILRDQRGDAPILILDDGVRQNVIDPDLFFGSVVSISKDNRPQAPVLAAPELQAQVKARDQAVDLMHRGLPGQPQPRRELPSLTSVNQNQPPVNVRVVEPDEVKDWLPDVLPQIHRQVLEEGEVKDD